MKRNMMFLSACFGLLTLLCSGCRTDYSANAVESARAYALEKLHGITSSQRAFIKFTQPDIYENLIFPRYVTPVDSIDRAKTDNYKDFPQAPYMDLMHSCVVWSPPDLGAKIVVVGDGQRNMHNWSPKRVMIKRYIPADPGYTSAVTACQSHALNSMLYLSTEDLNRIRFSDPAEIVFTKIDIELPHVKEKAGKSDWELYLMELNASKQEYSQISLIWKGNKADECVVFTGLTTTGSLKGWKLQSAELMSTAKLNKNRLSAAESKKIKVAPAAPLPQIHPAAGDVKRVDPSVTPDAPMQGGSIIIKR